MTIAVAVVMLASACGGEDNPTGPSQTPQPAPQPAPAPQSGTRTFSNSSSISIPSGAPGTTRGPANPYPSTIGVTGMAGTITKVVVSISGVSHPFPDDLAILLVGPAGHAVLFMYNAGCGFAVANLLLTFDQTAAQPLPDETLIAAGTYRPTTFGNVAVDLFDAPAPPPPYNLSLDVFNGTSPNGTWRLFVIDDEMGDVGTIAGGWSLTISSGSPAVAGSISPSTTRQEPRGSVLTTAGGCGATERHAEGK